MPSSPPPAAESTPSLGSVSRYDRVAGLIISLLLLLGMSVAVLLFMWLGSRLVTYVKTVPVVLQPESPGGSETGTTSEGMTLESPTAAEVLRETNVVIPDFKQSLQAVEDLVANKQAELDTALMQIDAVAAGGGRSVGTGTGLLFGSGRGTGGLSRSQRWEIHYSAGDTLDAYAKELDFFGIELAAVAADGTSVYARNLAQPKPTVDRNRSEPESRLYMQWRAGSSRRETDRKLLAKAGIDTAGRTLVQFIPPAVEEQLAQLEYAFAKVEAKKIRKTRFAVRPQGKGYEFFVAEQTPL